MSVNHDITAVWLKEFVDGCDRVCKLGVSSLKKNKKLGGRNIHEAVIYYCLGHSLRMVVTGFVNLE